MLTCCVHFAKCLSVTKYRQNPNQTVLNKVLRGRQHHMTHFDTFTKWFELYYAVLD